MQSLLLLSTRARVAVRSPGTTFLSAAAFSSTNQVIDPTMIHEYKHNYDESEWALEQPGLASHMEEEEPTTHRSAKGKFIRIGPAANSMARLWQKTKQHTFSTGDQSARRVLTAPFSIEQDLKTSNPTTNKTKHSRTWPITHHSPPYSMSYYHVPKTNKKNRSFCTNIGGSNMTLKQGEWAMMAGSFPSEQQLAELFLESIQSSRNGDSVLPVSSIDAATSRAVTAVTKTLPSSDAPSALHGN